MREITKIKFGIPFYDHFKGLEWRSTSSQISEVNEIKHPRKEVELDASNTSRLLEAARTTKT